MFKNIGGKIKVLAKVLFLVEAVAAVIVGLTQLKHTDGVSLLIALVAVFIAWISSWFLYGFGEIIDKLCDIERNTRGGAQEAVDHERIQKIEGLRLQGLITEEEYQQAMSKIE